MTSRRRIGIALAAMVAVLFALGIGRSAWRRAQEPKYEGRTASEWVDYLVEQTPIHGSFPELPLKETSVALAALGASAEVSIFRESTFEDPWHTNLERLRLWAEDKPLLRSIGFLRSQNRRAWAVSDFLASNNLGFHWTNIAEPLREALESNDSSHFGFALLNLAHLRDGWTNALPMLTNELSNTNSQFSYVAVHVLNQFGSNAVPAIPALLTLIDSPKPWDFKTTRLSLGAADTFGRIGAPASEALPKLGDWLSEEIDSEPKLRLASAILRIAPDHGGARKVIAERLHEDPLVTLVRLQVLEEWHHSGVPNVSLAELVAPQLSSTSDTSDFEAAKLLLRHDPYQARMALYSWLEADDSYQENQVTESLLQHNPHDRIAIHHLTSRIQSPGLVELGHRIAYVSPFKHCLPDSPGVVELLKSIQPAPDDEALRNAIRETLRHIELNGKLKELRERDAAAIR